MSPFEAELNKRIGEEIERLTSDLSAGNLADFSAYKAATAQISAYQRVRTEFFDDVRTELSKR